MESNILASTLMYYGTICRIVLMAIAWPSGAILGTRLRIFRESLEKVVPPSLRDRKVWCTKR
jgi:hypothetical protein